MADLLVEKYPISANVDGISDTQPAYTSKTHRLLSILTASSIILILFLNYFLSQFDKFVLSYFQTPLSAALHLSSSEYGILSGYATGIVYALMALPTAFVADYTESRVWVLSIATLWWSLCVVFQGLSRNFWQMLLARIGMGIGQAPVEALSVSLISDVVGPQWLFLGESILYVGVYVGEAVSGRIATAFTKTNTPWSTALKAVGIVGIVLAVIIRILVREPVRRTLGPFEVAAGNTEFMLGSGHTGRPSKISIAKANLAQSFRYIISMKSFWLLTLSSGLRQLSGNIFGYYMPSHLAATFPTEENLFSNYGLIVGIVGSSAVVAGGFVCSLTSQTIPMMPLYLTAFGGMLSSIFVILMVLSGDIAHGDQQKGVGVLYGVMSVAYLTAELWLGAFASFLVLLLPKEIKTFGLAGYMAVITLIYSSGPQIIGLAQRSEVAGSDDFNRQRKVILAVLIPVGYWLGGIGCLLCIPKGKMDLTGNLLAGIKVSKKRKDAFVASVAVLGCLVISLFVTSLVYR